MTVKVNLRDKLEGFTDHWSPRTVAEFNGHDIMVVRVEGAFERHHHDDTDDLFLILSGEIDIELENKVVTLGPGELIVVPAGMPHRPVARHGEVTMLLMERSGTPNTGDPATAAPRIRA